MIRYRPTWVEISRRAFENNIRVVKQKAGSDTDLLAVLKANAYGHGATSLASLALRAGASSLGVSSLEEAVELRHARVRSPILILGSIYPFQNYNAAFKYKVTPTVASLDSLKALSRIAKTRHQKISFHLKVDTGMGRIGVSPNEAHVLLKWIKANPSLNLAGVYSHFSSADSHQDFSRKQMNQFNEIKSVTKQLGFLKTKFHMANSAALLKYPRSFYNMVRPGLILYGISPLSGQKRGRFLPVLTWRSKVIFLKKVSKGTPISYGRTFVTKRPSLIATLPVGYADGVPRLVSNKGAVLIRGKRCPIVGRVTMDQIMVDVTGLRVSIGDDVILIGGEGRQSISVLEWAQWAKTNAYEVCCGISNRVPRVMVS